MKNKVFSGALFAENLKRYIGLIIAGFLIMFVSAPFELLTQAKNPMYSAYFVEQALADQNVGFLIVQFSLPVCAAVAVFQYLYKVNSTSMVHAMPFSRTKLYVTNYISGLVIALIPQILNWILLIALRRPTYMNYIVDSFGSNSVGEDIYTFAACCEWLLAAFVIVFFTYSIAVLACMVSGNEVIATLTGFAFNVLAAVLMIIVYGYITTNCFGYDGESAIIDMAVKTHPIFMMITESITIKNIIIFMLIALVIAIAGRFIYYLRKLERCGDSYVFTIMQDIIGFIFVLSVSSATGLLLFNNMGFTAYLIGGLIGFVIGQMITRKTFRLWNKKTLKNFIIFFVLMVLVVTGFMFDVFGIEKRVPNESRIEFAEYSESFMSYVGDYEVVTSDNPEVIAAVRALHGDICTDLDEIKTALSKGYVDTHSMRIKYYLKNGSVIERRYELPDDFLLENDNIEKLINLAGHNEKAGNMKNLGAENLEMSISFNVFDDYGHDYYEMGLAAGVKAAELTDVQKQAILEALSEDLKNSDISDRLIGKNTLINIGMEKTFSGEEIKRITADGKSIDQHLENTYYGFNGFYNKDFGSERVAEFSFGISRSYKKTIRVIEEITGKSLRDLLMPEDCIAVVGGSGDFLWKFLGNYQGNDLYFRNIPREGEAFFTVDDPDAVFEALADGSGRYDSSRVWISLLKNVKLSGTPAYEEVYTAWITVDSLPDIYKIKAEKILANKDYYTQYFN